MYYTIEGKRVLGILYIAGLITGTLFFNITMKMQIFKLSDFLDFTEYMKMLENIDLSTLTGSSVERYSASAGAHTHTLTAKGTVSSTFTGASATTSSVGSGSAINVQNPYTSVYMYKRTA